MAADPMRWVWRGITAMTLVAGWIFILVQNKFHIDPPVVVVMLAYLAVVMTVTNLWRVGAAAVSPESGDDTWGKPLGERGELEREKNTLLRSIKEAEFDYSMNKLSKADFEQLNAMYRARAIEVIKALDELDAGTAETPRQKIEREVAARLKVEIGEKKGKKKAEDKKAKAEDKKSEAKKPEPKADEKAEKAEKAEKVDEAKAEKVDEKAEKVDEKAEKVGEAKAEKADAKLEDAAPPVEEKPAAAAEEASS